MKFRGRELDSKKLIKRMGLHVDAHVARFKFNVHWVGRVSTLQWPRDRNTGRQLTV